MCTLTVIKRNIHSQETWRYCGEPLHREPNRVILVAHFDREDVDFHGMPLCHGDRFIETYYTDRWYNVFEIHSHEDDHLRGWYCNITRPAIITEREICYDDLALDLLVFPDGRQIVLDIEEFSLLDIPEVQRASAWDALKYLQAHFRERQEEAAVIKSADEAPGA